MSSADTDVPTEEQEVAPDGDEQPPDERRTALLARLAHHLGDDLVESHIEPGFDLWIRVPATAWRRVHEVARYELGFKFFEFLSAIDWMPSPWGKSEDADVDTAQDTAQDTAAEETDEPQDLTRGHAGGETRFQVFSRLVNIGERDLAVIIKADTPDPREDETASVESIVAVFPGANWHEREIHEMFGIRFDGHPYLEPLYLPSEFEGNPLRKDFPLLARHVKPWPGIVDVEPMPEEDDAEDDDADEGGDES